MILSFRKWTRGTGAAAAAVFREVADHLVHVLEVGAVNDEAPFLPALYEAGTGEMREME